jgi:hypothetical protein
MKNGFAQIIGKQVAAVVVTENSGAPRNQVFLVFADGSRLEVRGESFSCRAGQDEAGEALRELEGSGAKVHKVFGNVALTLPRVAAPKAPESLEATMERDLAAWRVAKAAIATARQGE